MRALGEKAREPRLRIGNGLRARDADGIEAARLRFADERLPNVSRIVQKSRSA
jgi:hypothetical protein